MATPDPREPAILILSTAPNREEATAIARTLVDERLAACVQLSPIESWYRWEGRIEHQPETRLHIKTMAHLADRVEARIRAMHSYAVPEIVILPLGDGSADYLGWIAASTRAENR